MIRFLDVLWWTCAVIAALSFVTDMIWLDGQTPAWVALIWLGSAVMYRLNRRQA